MENIGIIKLKEELERLNPHAQLAVCTHWGVPFDEYIKSYSFGSSDFVIYSDVQGEELICPEDYYYTEKNGITDKHNTSSGLYENFMYKFDPSHFDIKSVEVPRVKKSFWARLLGK